MNYEMIKRNFERGLWNRARAMERANGGSGGKKRCDQRGAVPRDHWRGLCLDKQWRTKRRDKRCQY